ncbi:MAG: hypothetical protein A3C15_01090 [Candidatus Magasanikbacteria bacterium RIFCSPHIGHO2_02_FULL_50_9b]|uniref:Probable cytosol aminopeptidase n=1 Tax=Candidatus Magasanikbacteria bacterium RIFCSPHIGHO2_02_FULL_50_9b TaxID=1798682 RepID=A0A1F6M986_9BACT|nr:MAG: hypothetical protein A3C15_01090 [Candidatus Magasanikbacteria bacterium RIFCSPHIGHO2_02_FULL_50_9b]
MKYLTKSTTESVAGVLIVPVFKNEKKRLFGAVNTPERVTGEAGEQLQIVISDAGGTHEVLFLGLGDAAKITPHSFAIAVAHACKAAQEKKQVQFTVYVREELFRAAAADARALGELLSRYIGLATYQFTEYMTDEKRHLPEMASVTFVNVPLRLMKAFQQGLLNGQQIDVAVRAARALGNHTPSNMHPAQLGAEAVRLGRGIKNLTVRVLGKKEIEKEKMGGLLGVSAGSERPPAFIIMHYRGARASDAPTIFVGKGVTFDSGGISIKPSDKMDEMKFDMMGGATVIGALLAIATLKLPVNVIGLVPATENLPSGTAIVPSDILHMHSGKTVEVLNTDAEGRLILADALSFAQRFKPKQIIDLATLTGACVVALGESRAGLWSTDEKLVRRLQDAATATDEKVWHMPLGDDYSMQLKSEVADLKNITERWGSANTAAAFLQEFAGDAPWAHIDIAGVAYSSKLQPSRRHGATGWGVALLTQLVRR